MLRRFSSEPVVLADLLSQLGETRAAGPIRTLLSHPQPAVRVGAAAALARLGEPQWSQWVKGDIGDFVRIGSSGAPEAVDLLKTQLGSFITGVRPAVARAFGLTKDPRALQALIGILEGCSFRDEEVRESAAVALRTLFGSLSKEEVACARVLESLNKMLERGSETATELMGWLGDARAIESLTKALGRVGPLRQVAAAAMDRLGEPQWREWVQGNTGDFARLGRSRDPRAFGVLLEALKSEGAQDRQAAVEALAEWGDPRAIEPLVAAVKDSKWAVRKKAAAALITVGSQTMSMPVAVQAEVRSLMAAPHLDSHEDGDISNCNPGHYDRHGDEGVGLDVSGTVFGTDF